MKLYTFVERDINLLGVSRRTPLVARSRTRLASPTIHKRCVGVHNPYPRLLMATKNFLFKSHAFQSQSGRCYYCGLPMWLNHPKHFASEFSITIPQAKQLQCTAEHLIARQDGGPTSRENIVAACLFCNQKRHQRKITLAPKEYKKLVTRRLSVQKWHGVMIKRGVGNHGSATG